MYRRRTPEGEVLYDVLREGLAAFLALTEDESGGLPKYVEKELEEYLRCGILAHGFVRMRCNDCGKSVAVAFSCKGRGFCPSCTGRRMADTSARPPLAAGSLKQVSDEAYSFKLKTPWQELSRRVCAPHKEPCGVRAEKARTGRDLEDTRKERKPAALVGIARSYLWPEHGGLRTLRRKDALRGGPHRSGFDQSLPRAA